jgi:hypothetical protein
MTAQTLSALQQQLLNLQGSMSQDQIRNNPVTPGTSKEEIRSLLKEVLSEELAVIKSTIQPVQKMTLLQALGNVLVIEDQNWLSKPEILGSIPDFIMTEPGKESVKLFVEAYRRYHENKT